MAFLNKKPWHPGSGRNQEDIWKREQAFMKEVEKREELKKQIEEQREQEEFDDFVADATKQQCAPSPPECAHVLHTPLSSNSPTELHKQYEAGNSTSTFFVFAVLRQANLASFLGWTCSHIHDGSSPVHHQFRRARIANSRQIFQDSCPLCTDGTIVLSGCTRGASPRRKMQTNARRITCSARPWIGSPTTAKKSPSPGYDTPHIKKNAPHPSCVCSSV
jgi:hypothetical protein